MNLRKYTMLLAVVIFGASGDTLLSRGMRGIDISLANWTPLFYALLNPWVIAGMVSLIIFFACYLSALSWADLTYVLPATAIGYVVLALFAKFLLHENVTPARWLGILLITAGVGFVTAGPELTQAPAKMPVAQESAVMTEAGQ